MPDEKAKEMLRTLRHLIVNVRRISIEELAQKLELGRNALNTSFTSGSMTMSRFYKILDITGITLQEINDEMKKDIVYELTMEQESFLLKNPEVLLTAVLLGSHWTMGQIKDQYDFSKDTVRGIIKDLEDLKLIKKNGPEEVREFLGSPNFKWQPDGPMIKYIMSSALPDFIGSKFEESQSYFKMIPITLSKEAHDEVKIIFEKALDNVRDVIRNDSLKADAKNRSTCTIVIALKNRKWQFEDYRGFNWPPTDNSGEK